MTGRLRPSDAMGSAQAGRGRGTAPPPPQPPAPGEWGLYVVTDRKQTGGRPLSGVVSAALREGARAIQLREKDLATRDLCLLLDELLPLTRAAGAALLVNDRVDVVMAYDADGVHLTRASLPPTVARQLLGPERLIGVSCHSPDEAAEAAAGGADFAVLGPIYETPSKMAYGPPIGLGAIERARARIDIPILGIGGITAARAPAVIAAGADGVAAISAVMAAADPGAAADLIAAVRAAKSEIRGRR